MKSPKNSSGLILVDSSLIKWALHSSNSFSNELAMHSILRATYRNGVIRYSAAKGKSLALLIGVTEPTARKRFNNLLEKKWVVGNSKAKFYRIVSSKVLLKRYDLVLNQAALLRSQDLRGKNPIGYFIGAYVGFQNKMQLGQRRIKTVGRKLNDSVKGLALPVNGLTNGKSTPSASYSKCTDKRLSQNLGCNEKKAQRFKSKAKNVRSIQVEPMARADPGFLPPGEMNLYLKYSGIDEVFLGRVEKDSGTYMYLRAASKITSFVPVLARRWIGKRKNVS